ncbi:MAG: 30S ribosomal protein S11 [Candidatus Andersenbacteria bacterium]|nr:30S ribosomal protein S11 [Candidatus Andersenbacteria bacterium]
MTTTAKSSKKKSRGRPSVRQGKIYIQSTYNNTIISITDGAGNVLAQSSAGRVGFSGTRKATPYAAQRAVVDVLEKVKTYGLQEAIVFVKGIGSAREAAIRSLNVAGLTLKSIRDITPIPHNGVRPPQRRRV